MNYLADAYKCIPQLVDVKEFEKKEKYSRLHFVAALFLMLAFAAFAFTSITVASLSLNAEKLLGSNPSMIYGLVLSGIFLGCAALVTNRVGVKLRKVTPANVNIDLAKKYSGYPEASAYINSVKATGRQYLTKYEAESLQDYVWMFDRLTSLKKIDCTY
jgi:hypothetical protein